MLLLGLVTFVCSLLLDLLYVWWIQGISQGKAVVASVWSGIFVLVSGVVTVLFVNDLWLIPVAALGHSVGTYLGVRFKRS